MGSIVILFIICFILTVYYPKLRGFMGEFWLRQELEKLNVRKYKLLNDIMIEDENGTHQIDHIIISKYGIFVIEMKNFYGLICGNDYSKKWKQYLGKNKIEFYNPLFQNYGHVKVLSKFLNINEEKFVPIICFSNQVKLKVKSNKIVTQLGLINKEIKKINEIIIDEDIEELYHKIKSANIKDKKRRKMHVKSIRENKIKDDNLSKKNLCPICNSELVERKGKYGTFIGCSNYPKCRYTVNNKK